MKDVSITFTAFADGKRVIERIKELGHTCAPNIELYATIRFNLDTGMFEGIPSDDGSAISPQEFLELTEWAID